MAVFATTRLHGVLFALATLLGALGPACQPTPTARPAPAPSAAPAPAAPAAAPAAVSGEPDIRWLVEHSMLHEAELAARRYSGQGQLWQHPYAIPQPRSASALASVWFTAYPPSQITGAGESVLESLGDPELWRVFRDIGIGGMHTGPMKRAGGIRGREYTPTVDGNFDRISSEIDARGRIVMPGFIDTHHHQFETALRSFLADGLLFNDGAPHGAINYFQYILGTFAGFYRPSDIYISELFGSLSQLDAGVTTSHDISQIHYSKEHSEAAIRGSADSGRRIVFGFFEGARADLLGSPPGAWYPEGAKFLRNRYFSSSDQLMTMFMGGEIYLLPQPDVYTRAWTLGRELGLPIAAHIVGSFGMEPEFTAIARGQRKVQFGADNLFIHMTGMSDDAWNKVKEVGAGVSLAVPIEMNMRHGTPPILKTLSMGVSPSLSVDVEVTLSADMFTQMRSAMNLQRMFINAKALGESFAAGVPDQELLTTRDVLRFATQEGANDLKLGSKVGSLTPGKEADIVILDAEAINIHPLNVVPGAVVSLMDRSNVETVIVAGKVRKWNGKLLDLDLRRLRDDLEDSRDSCSTRPASCRTRSGRTRLALEPHAPRPRIAPST